MMIPKNRSNSGLVTKHGTKDQVMWGHHLKRRGRWWHYFRSVPERYRDVEVRRETSFSLRTQDFIEAKIMRTAGNIVADGTP